jgi:inner membrane protein
MDPVTQVSLGAAAAALVSRPASLRSALIIGAIAGAVPDLDVLIQSEHDPLLSLEYHRHFSHSLFMVPVIGCLVALVYKGLLRSRAPDLLTCGLYAIMGTLSHGLLDACTSYGTRLYWPFSQYRESWDLISIIDPLFTLPMLLLLLVAFIRKRVHVARSGLILACIYLGFAAYQQRQAHNAILELAQQRAHGVHDLVLRPSFANTVVWRSVYQHQGTYYVDAVRVLPGREAKYYPGDSTPVLNQQQIEAWAQGQPQTLLDVARFQHFSQGYLYQHPDDAAVLADLRYALLPDSIYPLWGIRRPDNPENRVEWVQYRKANQSAVNRLMAMLRGQSLTVY